MPLDVPVLRGGPDETPASIRPVAGEEPLTFETFGISDAADVTLIPYYRLHHERYTLNWKTGV